MKGGEGVASMVDSRGVLSLKIKINILFFNITICSEEECNF